MSYKLIKKIDNCLEVLEKAKNTVKAFVFDFDGTLKSSAEPECNPIELIEKILAAGKNVGIVTASGASALMGLGKQMKNGYLGIANGTALYKIDDRGLTEIYKYPVKTEDISVILDAWKKVIKENDIKETDLVEKGLNTFREFFVKDWGEYIPKNMIDMAKEYNGRCFVENMKITLVMPKKEVFSQEKFVALMQMELDKSFGTGKYIIDMGDTTFAHVTIFPGMVPKLSALKRIQKELGLRDDEITTFGDMPNGNDKGLLIDSKLPYTFTNKFVE
ncbi:MAG: HAD hydrolase family protein, partial [Candidatus Shapirobacteria bacterium]|nr:HAD hydrolase family protein [Candidatus Shapirobacteria bacterium]